MPIKIPASAMIALNIVGWPAIQISVAWIITRLPTDRFRPHSRLYRLGTWEASGHFYENIFAVRRWKHILPDGAPWLGGGFPKANLNNASIEYLNQFIIETCRGELAHWIMLLAAPIFFLWNPPWADAVMVGYALAANLPCIIVQRYNRNRMQRAVERQSKRNPRAAI